MIILTFIGGVILAGIICAGIYQILGWIGDHNRKRKQNRGN